MYPTAKNKPNCFAKECNITLTTWLNKPESSSIKFLRYGQWTTIKVEGTDKCLRKFNQPRFVG